jgi:transketolase
VLRDCAESPALIIIATGSEIGIAVSAFDRLSAAGLAVRVVSMPSADVFEAQEQTYQDAVLPPSCRKRIAVEAAQSDYWWKWVGLEGRIIGLTSFGESGPGPAVMSHFGFTVENIVTNAQEMI